VTDLVRFSQIEMAVTRTTIGVASGKYSFPLNRTMGLSLREALVAHTYGGAFQLHRDRRVGSLAVGKDADLLLLDQNLFRVPIDEVHATRPLLTMVRGRQLSTGRAFDG
jgi:predicted amidohydrolase YtcJ